MSEDDSVRRIHFLTEVEDYGAAYKCKKCGHTTATTVEMYEHRKGIINHCDWERFKQWLQALRNKQ